MAALTLADYAANPKPLIAGVANVLRKASPLMDRMKFVDAGTLAIQVMRSTGRPAVSWRKIGNSHGSTKGTKPDLVTETAFSFGNTIDVDKAYVKAGSQLYDPRAYWEKMTLESMTFEFNDAFINGIPTANADRPTGIFYRVMNDLPSSQHLNANGLDISPDASSLSTNIQTYLDWLDKLIYACDGHKADLILLNDTLLQRHWSAARQSGLLKTTTDNLGREFAEYKGAVLIDMGFKADDSTKIITDVEASNGTALTGGGATSAYAIKLGVEYLTGWQTYALDVQDKGELEDGVTYRTVVDWLVGLAVTNPRSIARLSGVIAA